MYQIKTFLWMCRGGEDQTEVAHMFAVYARSSFVFKQIVYSCQHRMKHETFKKLWWT